MKKVLFNTGMKSIFQCSTKVSNLTLNTIQTGNQFKLPSRPNFDGLRVGVNPCKLHHCFLLYPAVSKHPSPKSPVIIII